MFRRGQLMIWHQNWSISMFFRRHRYVNWKFCRCKMVLCYAIFDRIAEQSNWIPELRTFVSKLLSYSSGFYMKCSAILSNISYQRPILHLINITFTFCRRLKNIEMDQFWCQIINCPLRNISFATHEKNAWWFRSEPKNVVKKSTVISFNALISDSIRLSILP